MKKSIHTIPTNETIKISHSLFPMNEEHLNSLFEYKYVLHKFQRPLNKNIRSIQARLNFCNFCNFSQPSFDANLECTTDVCKCATPLSNIRIELSLFLNETKITDNVELKPNTMMELLQFQYLPMEIIQSQLQIIATVRKNGILSSNHRNTIQNTPPENNKINIDLFMCYSNFTDKQIDHVVMPHSDDVRKLVVKNGNAFLLKTHYL